MLIVTDQKLQKYKKIDITRHHIAKYQCDAEYPLFEVFDPSPLTL